MSFHQTDLKRHAVVEVCAHMKEEARERLIDIVLSAEGHAVTFFKHAGCEMSYRCVCKFKDRIQSVSKTQTCKMLCGSVSNLPHTIGTLKCLPDNLLYF